MQKEDVFSTTSVVEREAIRPTSPTKQADRGARRRYMLRAADVAALSLGASLGWLAQGGVDSNVQDWLVAALVGVAYVSVGLSGAHRHRNITNIGDEVRRIAIAISVGLGWYCFGLVIAGVRTSVLQSLVWIGVATVASLLTERLLARAYFRRQRAKGVAPRRTIVVADDVVTARTMESVAESSALGYEVVGRVGAIRSLQTSIPYLGHLRDLDEIVADEFCSGVVLSMESLPSAQVNRLTRDLTDRGLHVTVSSSLQDIETSRLRPQSFDGQTMWYVDPTQRDGWRAVAKRAFDIAVSTVALIAVAPVLLASALIIKATSPGPVLFRQERVGRDGELFHMIKLRSMYVDAEERKAALLEQNDNDGPLFKMKNDPRITPFGRFIRKHSLDELPQFWNVLIGEMSVVGPRPALPNEMREWSDDLHDRLRVLPGITGLWQVSDRTSGEFESYRRLDLFYVHNWSIWHDIKIVLRTVAVVVAPRGSY